MDNAQVPCLLNGFGRIGRLLFRSILSTPSSSIKITHINDVIDVKQSCYLLKYDSVHGAHDCDVRVNESNGNMVVNGVEVTYSQVTDKKCIALKDDVAMVLDCTGDGMTLDSMVSAYMSNDSYSVRKVLVSGPVKGANNIVRGCNEHLLDDANCDVFTNA